MSVRDDLFIIEGALRQMRALAMGHLYGGLETHYQGAREALQALDRLYQMDLPELEGPLFKKQLPLPGMER